MATKKKTVKKATTAKVPTKSKVTKEKTKAQKPVAKKTRAPKAKTPAKGIKAFSAEERYRMIQQAAYYLAEKQGFQGDDAANWIRAEKEVDALIQNGKV